MPEYRVMTDELIKSYMRYWNVADVKSWERITAGIANSNYKVQTNSGTFLLKICEEDRLDKVDTQLEALLRLQEYDYQTAFPYKLHTKDGMANTEYLLVNEYAMRHPEPIGILFNFLPGTPGEAYNSNPQKIRSLGMACGSLAIIPAPASFHHRTLRFPPGETIKEFLQNLPSNSEFSDHPFVEKYLRRELPEILKSIRNPLLPRAITHGDLFLDNCLWDEENNCVSSVLDFEEVCYEPAILDVAMTIMGSCFEEKEQMLNIEWAKAFLEGYCSVRPLSSLEMEVLPQMMQFCIISATFWRFNQFNVLHPELQMQERYLELLKRGEHSGIGSLGGWWEHPLTIEWRNYTLTPMNQNTRYFTSTRGGKNIRSSFKEALFSGYAPDGGLYIPANPPQYTTSDLKQFVNQSYPSVVKKILGDIISKTELSTDEISALVDKSFASFSTREVLPIIKLWKSGEEGNVPIHILEMFHGTTGAFKDLSMSLIGSIMKHFLARDRQHRTIVVGTSGDTGSAAIHAVRSNEPNSFLDIVVLYPLGRISRIQELQMSTNPEPNVHVFGVEGTSDDLDVPIKSVLSDFSFVAKHNLCSINSINLARVVIQAAHFFYSYGQLISSDACGVEQLVVSIPSGACGDLAGAFIAMEMGLPLKLVASVNENDILTRVMTTGKFHTVADVVSSTSPSMDIQVPYNWERIIYYASRADISSVVKFMKQFGDDPRKGAMMMDSWMNYLHTILASKSSNQSQVIAITQKVYHQYQFRNIHDSQASTSGYILDPHTAVGVAGYFQAAAQLNPVNAHPVIILSTATPHKFEESVKDALNIAHLPNPPPAFERLEQLQNHQKIMHAGTKWEETLRNTIISITSKHLNA